MLDRMVEMLRLATRLKFPSKSASTRAVIARLGEGSTHSKLLPIRKKRAFTWNSGAASGPVSTRNIGNGKSLPSGDELSRIALALKNPYGVRLIRPSLMAGTRPSRLGGSTGKTRIGPMPGITGVGFGACGAGAAAAVAAVPGELIGTRSTAGITRAPAVPSAATSIAEAPTVRS